MAATTPPWAIFSNAAKLRVWAMDPSLGRAEVSLGAPKVEGKLEQTDV